MLSPAVKNAVSPTNPARSSSTTDATACAVSAMRPWKSVMLSSCTWVPAGASPKAGSAASGSTIPVAATPASAPRRTVFFMVVLTAGSVRCIRDSCESTGHTGRYGMNAE